MNNSTNVLFLKGIIYKTLLSRILAFERQNSLNPTAITLLLRSENMKSMSPRNGWVKNIYIYLVKDNIHFEMDFLSYILKGDEVFEMQ